MGRRDDGRFLSGLQLIDYMDSPNKFVIGKHLLNALKEKKCIDADNLSKALKIASEVSDLSYPAKQFM